MAFDWKKTLGSIIGGAVEETELKGLIDRLKQLDTWMIVVAVGSVVGAVAGTVSLLISLFKRK